ncbi:MAG: hypothetical protein ABI432_08990 [Flavobacteriales bacterium]
MRAITSQIVDLYGLVILYREQVVYDLSITGQTFSLEIALNDRFDNVSRQIYIANQIDPTLLFIYRKEEARPPLYVYRKWNSAGFYGIGSFCTRAGKVWECVAAHFNQPPGIGSTFWDLHGDMRPILKRKEESQLVFDFIVMVPVALVFDNDEMRALVDRYRIASKRYTIQTF